MNSAALRRAGVTDTRSVLEGERHLPFAQHSYVDLFRDTQRVFKLDTEIPHCAVHLGVAEQKLDRAKVASFTVD